MPRLPAAQRREQLLECAAGLFSSRGYARTTTAELAKAAGVTEPIIYRHFKSKRDLFVALIERTGKRTLDQWSADLADATDPADRLRRLIGDNPMVSRTGRDPYRVFLQAISEIDDEQIQQAVGEHISSVHAFVTDEIRRAQQKHRVAERFSAESIAWMMIHMGMGYGVMSAMNIQHHGIDSGGVHVKDILARILVGPE